MWCSREWDGKSGAASDLMSSPVLSLTSKRPVHDDSLFVSLFLCGSTSSYFTSDS